MRQAQKEILTAVAQRLSMQPVATTVSDDSLAYFTTPDKQTSIALQVGMQDPIPHTKHAPVPSDTQELCVKPVAHGEPVFRIHCHPVWACRSGRQRRLSGWWRVAQHW